MALSVKAFDPSGSNAFTLRAFFLAWTAELEAWKAVPDRLAVLGARPMIWSRRTTLSFDRTSQGSRIWASSYLQDPDPRSDKEQALEPWSRRRTRKK